MAHALEVTSNNEIRKLNSGLEQRLETTKSALTAAFNGLKGTIDDILARLAALEAKMGDVTTKQPVSWNTPLENRLKAIEAKNTAQDTAITNVTNTTTNHNTRITALEGKSSGALTYKTVVTLSTAKGSQSSGPHNYDLCVLSSATFSTVEDNHGHTCTVSRASNGYTLAASGTKGSQGCRMMCFDM